MSLINDALKKAQRQRGDEPAGEQPASPGTGRVARREKPPGFQALILRLGVGVIAVCAIIVTTVMLVRSDDAPATTAPPIAKSDPIVTAPPPAVVPKADPVVTPPAATKTDAPPATVAATTPPVTPPEQTPATPPVVAQTAPPASPPASTGPIKVPDLTLPPVTDAPQIPAPATPAEQDKRILAYLSTLRITGIRPAGADSKVLMNDRVYKLNDVVDYSLGLKLTAVAVQRLDFVDERGVGYVKQF